MYIAGRCEGMGLGMGPVNCHAPEPAVCYRRMCWLVVFLVHNDCFTAANAVLETWMGTRHMFVHPLAGHVQILNWQ